MVYAELEVNSGYGIDMDPAEIPPTLDIVVEGVEASYDLTSLLPFSAHPMCARIGDNFIVVRRQGIDTEGRLTSVHVEVLRPLE